MVTIGARFGRLVVQDVLRNAGRKNVVCLCDCGTQCLSQAGWLTRGSKSSCGCLRREIRSALNALRHTDLSGRRFGRLVVLGRATYGKTTTWTCRCDCGNLATVFDTALKRVRKPTTSCGCFRTERVKATHTKHGMASSREYAIWLGMLRRCENRSDDAYRLYGGRGIRVCQRWHSFELFLADMGVRPSHTSSIERQNVDGDYEPGNCVWIERSQQSQNRRNNWRFVVDGNDVNMAMLREHLGLSDGYVRELLRTGRLSKYQPRRQSAN